MGRFVVLPFITGILMIIGAIVSVVSLPLPWATADAAHARIVYDFYLLGWETDFCVTESGSMKRYGYGRSYEFKSFEKSGICVIVMTVVGCIFSCLTAFYYLLHAFGFSQKCLKKIHLNVGRRTWILLLFGVLSLAINIIGMVLWLALFFSNNVAEWIAESSPNPTFGFYIELVSIIFSAFGIIIGMFWKHS